MTSKRGRTPLYLDSRYQYRTPAQRSNADRQGSSASSSNSSGVTGGGTSSMDADGRASKRGRRLQRACTFCRRSHLVCEEQRPCRRCVKRGIAAQCEEDDKEQQQTSLPPNSRPRQAGGASRSLRQNASKANGGMSNKTGRMAEHQMRPQQDSGSPLTHAVVVSAPMQSYQPHAAEMAINRPQSLAPHPQALLATSTVPVLPLAATAPTTTSSTAATSSWDDALFTSFFFDQDFSTHNMTNNAAMSTNFGQSDATLAHVDLFAATSNVAQQHEQPIAALPPPAAAMITRRRSSIRISPPAPATANDPALPRKRTKWFEPLPFRKGYASIVHHLQRNRWQPRNVESVKQALASVAQLWDAREDSMQFSDLLQVHAQWATYLNVYRDQVFPHSPIAMLACRKAGEIYAVSAAALQMFKRPASDFEDGQLAVYQLMTEDSAAEFFRLYEQAIRCRTLSASEREGSSVTLHWNARLHMHHDSHDASPLTVATHDNSITAQPKSIAARGVFHIKFSDLELPCLLVLSFIPL